MPRRASQILRRHVAPVVRDAESLKEAVVSSTSAPVSVVTPVVVPISRATLWLAGAVFLALAVYYFVGVDQGAYSVFGSDLHIHEFVHDGRHFLGFPCH
jgi:Probable cobalt transporter subunit (CbtB)